MCTHMIVFVHLSMKWSKWALGSVHVQCIIKKNCYVCFFCFFCFICGFTSQSMAVLSKPYHTFSLQAWLKQLTSTLCLCAHTLVCNWHQPFLNQWKKKNDRRKYFLINLHKRRGPGFIIQTQDPWICNWTCYRLHYLA